jgi:hypothetical protein
MPTWEWLHPLDQPFGTPRAHGWLREALGSSAYDHFRLIVAYAKEGELLRLDSEIAAFRKKGGRVEAVFGVDQLLTSRQALAYALKSFSAAWVWQHPSFSLTFHPKQYLFSGPVSAEIHVGSCNLTVGGLQTNCESAVRIAFTLPLEQPEWEAALRGWRDLHKPHANLQQLTPALLSSLEAKGLLADESLSTPSPNLQHQPKIAAGPALFPSTPYNPATPIPSKIAKAAKKIPPVVKAPTVLAPISLPVTLAIQIKPHHNGEVFLSKAAVNQYPAFFGYPFTGQTVPKRNNPPYPQRVPDPITDWIIHGKSGVVVLTVPAYNLNTVYYEKKSEIRVTISPQLRTRIPDYSLLLMSRNASPPADYTCEVFPPNSPQYQSLLQSCNQKMPGGGKTPRLFGWI